MLKRIAPTYLRKITNISSTIQVLQKPVITFKAITGLNGGAAHLLPTSLFLITSSMCAPSNNQTFEGLSVIKSEVLYL